MRSRTVVSLASIDGGGGAEPSLARPYLEDLWLKAKPEGQPLQFHDTVREPRGQLLVQELSGEQELSADWILAEVHHVLEGNSLLLPFGQNLHVLQNGLRYDIRQTLHDASRAAPRRRSRHTPGSSTPTTQPPPLLPKTTLSLSLLALALALLAGNVLPASLARTLASAAGRLCVPPAHRALALCPSPRSVGRPLGDRPPLALRASPLAVAVASVLRRYGVRRLARARLVLSALDNASKAIARPRIALRWRHKVFR